MTDETTKPVTNTAPRNFRAGRFYAFRPPPASLDVTINRIKDCFGAYDGRTPDDPYDDDRLIADIQALISSVDPAEFPEDETPPWSV